MYNLNMIARLKGTVVEKTNSTLIIDVGGVGYEVQVTDMLADKVVDNQSIIVYVHDHLRENSHELYGFSEPDARRLFELLITVSGVGPKMALSILNLGESSQIRGAIAAGNTAYISGASGVGKRLAERITVDLKDKVGVVAGQDISASAMESDNDVINALLSLGYSRGQASSVLKKIDTKASIEEQIKQALKEIG